MKIAHFEQIKPVCPLCLQKNVTSALHLECVRWAIPNKEAEEGHLRCPTCPAVYPILKGIPVILSDVSSWMKNHQLHLLWDPQTSGFFQQWLCDASGPGSAVESVNNYISSYMWSHYRHLDPKRDEPPSDLHGLLEQTKLDTNNPKMILDLGCAVGGSTQNLAERHQQLVLGIDLNFAMLLQAKHVSKTGQVRYGLRQSGVIYQHQDYNVAFPYSDLVDFWVADATCLPFQANSVSIARSTNLLDCTTLPLLHLIELLRVAEQACVACPYDWSINATEYAQWIGGHSSASDWKGDPLHLIQSLFQPDGPIPELSSAEIFSEHANLPWRVRLHNRAVMQYSVHAFSIRMANRG